MICAKQSKLPDQHFSTPQQRNVIKTYWYLPRHGEDKEGQDRARYLDHSEDVAIVIVDPPLDIDDSTAPACFKISRLVKDFDNLDGMTCFSTYYVKKGSSVKLMYSPLVMINKSEVSSSYPKKNFKHEYLRSRAYMYMFVTFITIRLSELLKLCNYRDTRAYILDPRIQEF